MPDEVATLSNVLEQARSQAFDAGLAAGRGEASVDHVAYVTLSLQADGLEACAARVRKHPGAVAALNEATAILRDAAKDAVTVAKTDEAEPVERPKPKPKAAETKRRTKPPAKRSTAKAA